MSLMVDIFDVFLVDSSGNTLASSTLSTADINISTNSVDVNAGRKDALIAILHSGRKVDISLAEVEFKWDWLAKQLGQTATTGAKTAWCFPLVKKAIDTEGTISITLDVEPLASDSGIKFTVDGATVTGTITGKNVTFATGVKKDDMVVIGGYKYTTAATTSEIIIDDTSFPDGVQCMLKTIEISRDEKPLSEIQYIFDKVLFDGNINIQTKKETDAVVTNIGLRAIKPENSTEIGRVLKIPYATT